MLIQIFVSSISLFIWCVITVYAFSSNFDNCNHDAHSAADGETEIIKSFSLGDECEFDGMNSVQQQQYQIDKLETEIVDGIVVSSTVIDSPVVSNSSGVLNGIGSVKIGGGHNVSVQQQQQQQVQLKSEIDNAIILPAGFCSLQHLLDDLSGLLINDQISISFLNELEFVFVNSNNSYVYCPFVLHDVNAETCSLQSLVHIFEDLDIEYGDMIGVSHFDNIFNPSKINNIANMINENIESLSSKDKLGNTQSDPSMELSHKIQNHDGAIFNGEQTWFEYPNKISCNNQSLKKPQFLFVDNSSSLNSHDNKNSKNNSKNTRNSNKRYHNRRGRKRKRYKWVVKNCLQHPQLKMFNGNINLGCYGNGTCSGCDESNIYSNDIIASSCSNHGSMSKSDYHRAHGLDDIYHNESNSLYDTLSNITARAPPCDPDMIT